MEFLSQARSFCWLESSGESKWMVRASMPEWDFVPPPRRSTISTSVSSSSRETRLVSNERFSSMISYPMLANHRIKDVIVSSKMRCRIHAGRAHSACKVESDILASSSIPACLMLPNPMTPTTPSMTTSVPTASNMVILVPSNHLANKKLNINEVDPNGATYSVKKKKEDQRDDRFSRFLMRMTYQISCIVVPGCYLVLERECREIGR